MYANLLLSLLTLLVASAEAGSRLWEVAPTASHLSHTSHGKRAISIQPSDDVRAVRLWPEKTLNYAYANREAEKKLSPILYQARQYWNLLAINGFKYNEISLRKCKLYRDECLVIHYNNRGKLACTVGLPPADKKIGYYGPEMHLSDDATKGNLDVSLNAAHELGHAWGLYHVHQNPPHWNIDQQNYYWPVKPNRPGDRFSPDTFHCENLEDYERTFASLTREEDKGRICSSQALADQHQFSAMEWLPRKNEGKSADEMFDPESLMLYPSVAGGKGDVVGKEDGRQPILTYLDGKLIPFRKGPSQADIKKLLTIYGSEYVGTSKLLIAKDSSMRRLVKKVRSTMSLRGGDTQEGLC
ncbi:hypothetical protein NW752_009452 [Fusarium irregulare]|uniref:Uncharacterized protein n=1 Tax=Fusarium irregulare TaxID=2494466 RepID=A0A9W8U430_9HYPO|nr:hypothetical protein NW766_012730 [Fusarium irregulare]KAJ4009154.1 hypothetical protein NW752_009452 [Fusarium irregulare]